MSTRSRPPSDDPDDADCCGCCCDLLFRLPCVRRRVQAAIVARLGISLETLVSDPAEQQRPLAPAAADPIACALGDDDSEDESVGTDDRHLDQLGALAMAALADPALCKQLGLEPSVFPCSPTYDKPEISASDGLADELLTQGNSVRRANGAPIGRVRMRNGGLVDVHSIKLNVAGAGLGRFIGPKRRLFLLGAPVAHGNPRVIGAIRVVQSLMGTRALVGERPLALDARDEAGDMLHAWDHRVDWALRLLLQQ